MSNTPNQIKNKINRHGFSGGRETEEEHRRLGSNPDVDVSYQYLSFFLEDDEELAQIGEDYRTGRLLTGQLKARSIKVLQEFTGTFQERRKAITDEEVKAFMDANRQIVPASGKQALPA
ncbi:tryptophanyl-tRNA synthetase-like protein [Lactarius deliciosus]|nr:tryptophanyl-tRNA synthetase-like protein [Lactarius deliciosus]